MSPVTRVLRSSLLTAVAVALAGGAAAKTITVDSDLDVDLTNGLCSLREAIVAANSDAVYNDCPAGAGPDRIVFAVPLPATILLNDHLPTITESLAIRGPGFDVFRLDGDHLYRPLDFEPAGGDGWLGVSDLTLVRGHSAPNGTSGGGAAVDGGTAVFERVHFLDNRAENVGGGLAVIGARVSIADCFFQDNVAEDPTGGGGLGTLGGPNTVEIVGSTFAGNRAEAADGNGGALRLSRVVATVVDSTFSGNEAGRSGGGIVVASSSSGDTELTLRHVTITGNTAATSLSIAGIGGGMSVSAVTGHVFSLSVENSVIAENVDLSAPFIDDLSCSSSLTGLAVRTPSFIGSNEGCETVFPAGAPNIHGDLVGTLATPFLPELGGLQNNGGPTPTHEPELAGPSPLIDAGSCPDAAADQRGHGEPSTGARLVDQPGVPDLPGSDGCDFGAVETGAVPLADPLIFTDGFEAGHTLAWSSEVEP